ncbi:sialate O-acetylesterase [Mariniflexile maritimum]|uniref:sialate O-acetylesterase n=1 Tax=Mariniflexile maritimum TaxID=2682493 RepID=UPI0012F66ECC|nr:sialate O-acetylesterase [Mariniflexile maritimum]HMR15219.1 sialate O-acetylesterase [Mariniflexile sp.]
MKLFPVFILLIVSSIANSQVTVAKIFGDNMVLQRHTNIPVWGFAKPNELIEVQFNQQKLQTKTDVKGQWMVKLKPETAGGPFELVVKGENTVVVKNILVGEVWLCSGQSNMELMVGQSDHAKTEIENASNYPNIRHIKIPKEINSAPNQDISSGNWEVCSASTAGNFTGVGYFFAKELYDNLQIPIGLINASWGGSVIETWISREGFENSDDFKHLIATMPKTSLDSLSNLKKATAQQRIETMQNAKFSTANVESYKDLDLDDSKWHSMNAPEAWETQELGEFDGVVWLRKHVTLLEEAINTDILLEIPAIDDEDITYVNGVKVGETVGWDLKRNYNIKAGTLKVGDNVIAIRVVDNGGGGGIYGDASKLKLHIGKKSMPLGGNWKYQVESVFDGINFNDYPSLCYNAMIHPLIPYAFQGVIWYQGESNIGRAYQYRKAFPLLINDWRKKWNRGTFPFYYVQLATFNSEGDSNTGCSWAELREAQTWALKLPNTGMVVTTDVGNPNDIHPTNKQTVGQRLSAIALNNVYKKPMVCSGPTYKSMEITKNKSMIYFEDLGSGLVSANKNSTINGFEIAGADQVFYQAKASIKEDKVLVFSKKVKKPVAVRYNWLGNASKGNLFNKEGFPAAPFRTDDWKTMTKGVEYKF